MSEPSSFAVLPERQIPDEQIEEYRSFYVELLGFVPPRIQARTDLLARLDPELLTMQEELRRHCMYPDCFDTKTSQLMLFAILLTNLQDAAKLHALAAYRAGATFEELTAVVNLVFLFRGLSAANLGAEILQGIANSAKAPSE
ncbi:MAG TPA: carboxymuconolactone decarboxylase family protein [Candidatus Saccharimonadales bacterium]|nr:carboxymuconolactone decarboxylase family protein [Candidatus Saccharimonadales bacterium]